MLMNYELQNIDTVVELMLKPYRNTTFTTGRYGKNFGGQNFIERFKENLKIRLEEERQSDVPVTLLEIFHDVFDESLLPE